MNPKHPAVEWIGGIVPMPAVVTGEGDPYRPEALLWMDADGLIQGSAVDKPGVLLSQAGARLNEAISAPLCGGDKPTQVRVASPELAAVLRETHTSKFGMAKSLFMGGREAGFDMGSQEGLDAWMRSIKGKPLPRKAKKKKNKRKATRAASKKNR